MSDARVREMLIRHEDIKLKPYYCSRKILTIGVGRNLQDNGISHLEAMFMLSNDIARVKREAVDNFVWFKFLNMARQDAILDMLFNLGLSRFNGFTRMIEAIRMGNFEKASQEMLDSEWATQVGDRAKELSQMMRSGLYL